MTFQWRVSPEDALAALARHYADEIEAKIAKAADGLTDQIAAWMKEEARWQDVTGDARAGLYSDVIRVMRQSVAILVSHGPAVEYSVYLETMRGGFFGIIADTVDHWGPAFFREAGAVVHGGGR